MFAHTDRPIFVLGCPRSGTTLLQLMLHSHHRIAVPAETRFVIPAWSSRCDFGDLRDSRNLRALADWITTGRGTKFANLGLDPERTADEIAAGPPTLGSALAIVFRAYARRFDRVRWGDKRPSYFRYVNALRRMYPDAQFIHMIRDGRDCVASLKEMPWYKQDINHAICVWREAIDHGRRYAAELGPDAYYELQYERLVADPADELMRLCAFLGEEYDPAMTEPHRLARLTVPPQRKWHRRTHCAVDGGSVGSWTRRLEPWEVGLAEAAFGDRLAEYGYEPSGAPRPTRGQLARLAKVSAHRRMSQSKQRLRERWRTRNEPNPVESLLFTERTGPAPLIVEPASPPRSVPGQSPVPAAEHRAEPARTGRPGS
ncbi:sulfotransferase [Actinomadura sp. NBRC 104425]|uniref:sulfotransferase family protein n=1 Tax=Actinomadura sp. NBRC 104425 TaxID=3032204 RepID=UPI0024A0ED23|nr:sulfotransferase [Actinomadura sp. NBRC 104425]GLZ12081.1 sulfotransferase [Actinomadura sp. NBRC 104425]